jgi:hypothetical protein
MKSNAGVQSAASGSSQQCSMQHRQRPHSPQPGIRCHSAPHHTPHTTHRHRPADACSKHGTRTEHRAQQQPAAQARQPS